MHKIQYLKHSEIDFVKWDNCIDKSYNGLIYPYAFFLNNMAGNQWDALVQGDYEAVFPLVWGKKFGFKFLYQPYFCQQLGLFSRTKISEKVIQAFISKIPSKFRYWNFHLNYENKYFSPAIRFINRSSYCINLNQDYAEIYDLYNSDAKKNLAKSVQIGFEYKKDIAIEEVSKCFFEAYGKFYSDVDTLQNQIETCARIAIQNKKGFTRGIYSEDGELWCAAFFFFSHKRIHYAMAAPTEAGKLNSATHMIIDEVLKEFSKQDLVFDFEGSDIKSVAYFYSKFGSVASNYLQIINNKLPWWCRFLKD
jgi:hypothetical protein